MSNAPAFSIVTRTTKVMLIEENDECREILADLMRLSGFQVVKAGEGIADVIVVYLDFPEMRGLRTILALRKNPQTRQTPIIVYLPWSYDDAVAAALRAGADEVFDRPLTFQALATGITKYAPVTKLRVA
jgi:DNA-binding response OmpR family regulator